MDDTNTTQAAPTDGMQQAAMATDAVQPAPVMPDPQPSMADLAGMTPPPPAPIQSEPAPAMDMQQGAAPVMPNPMPAASPANSAQPAGQQDEYAYAEDILEEILDSLDRIEAKLDAMEKKLG